MLDYCITKAIAAKHGIANKKLAKRMAYHDIIYFYKGLKAWIEKTRRSQNQLLYDDLKEFYNECVKYEKKEMKKRYLFCWDEIPGNDNKRLIKFLKNEFKIRKPRLT